MLEQAACARVEQAGRDEVERSGDGCRLEDRLALVSRMLSAHRLMGLRGG